jgi:hypothetical protein
MWSVSVAKLHLGYHTDREACKGFPARRYVCFTYLSARNLHSISELVMGTRFETEGEAFTVN